MLNRHGRPSTPGDITASADIATFSGNRGLQIEEPLLFETGRHDICGVDLEEPEGTTLRLGGMERKEAAKLPALSEPETMRHYVRQSQKNYARLCYLLVLVHIAHTKDGCVIIMKVKMLMPYTTLLTVS